MAERIADWSFSPIEFVRDMWGLAPQPLKKEFENFEVDELQDVTEDMFEPFIKGQHVTWQQWLVLLAFELALKHIAPRRISVVSGHGVGKDALAAWLILWYLICFEDAQVPCTAPTSDQLTDILWKEIAVWLLRMPDKFKNLYEWNSEYLRIKSKPETWFARARTGRKENPEALAGVHGEHVFVVVDEASGVDEVVFTTMEGALTGENFFIFMISNGTRTMGYFFDSHHKNAHKWQNLAFDGRQSPIVDHGYVQEMEDNHGIDSDEYAVRVAGGFPRTEGQDDKGYMPLFTEEILHFTEDLEMPGKKRLGVDPAGDGSDEAAWVARTSTKIRVTAREQISTPKGIAQKTLTQMDYYGVVPEDTAVDNFGVGADVGKEAALLQAGCNLFTVNVGDAPPEDADLYLDRRAQAYWRFRQWAQGGGEIIYIKGFKEELLSLRFRRDQKGRIQIMSKRESKKLGYRSPNMADAAMLTFVKSFETIITGRSHAKVVRTNAGRRRA